MRKIMVCVLAGVLTLNGLIFGQTKIANANDYSDNFLRSYFESNAPSGRTHKSYRGLYEFDTFVTENSVIHVKGKVDNKVDAVYMRAYPNGSAKDSDSSIFMDPVDGVVEGDIILRDGAGSYTIVIQENHITYIDTMDVKVGAFQVGNLDTRDTSVFVRRTIEEQSKDQRIIDLAKEIVKGVDSDYGKAKAIFMWVANNMEFRLIKHKVLISPEGTDAVEVLAKKKGNYKGLNNLTSALMLAVGLETKIEKGQIYMAYDDVNRYVDHEWNFVKVNGVWKEYDVSCAIYHKDKFKMERFFGRSNESDKYLFDIRHNQMRDDYRGFLGQYD